MPSRVLLISINQCQEPYQVFPLGLAHIDAALRQAGHATRWLDLRISPSALEAIVREFQPDYIAISIRNIDDVVIRKRETFYGPLTTICPHLRQLTAAPIIVGGSGFSIFPKELLALSGADFGICGEGESALVTLLDALEKGLAYSKIPGLVYEKSGTIHRNQAVQRSTTFSSAVRPEPVARHYLAHTSMLNFQTQRGCSHHCCYCTYPLIEGRTWRRRDPDDVAAEMASLQSDGARYVFIVDSVFNSSRAHAAAVCEAILRRGVKMEWGCFLRPQGLTADLMVLMRRAGLRHIEFGSDSFCDEVLVAYDKRLTFADIHESSELARTHQIEACHFLVCGGPGETRDTLLTTFENSRQLCDAVVLALVGMRVYPGTPIFERAAREHIFPAGTNFLEPQYYVSPGIEEDEAFALLRDFSRKSPNWIVGDPSPAYVTMAERLRAKGVVGPLWSYFAAMQRLGLTFAQPVPARVQGATSISD